MASALLIANPRAGRNHPDTDSVTQVLGDHYELETVVGESPQAAQRAARRAADDDYAAVFTLGGDGTARQAAATLLGSSTALGVLPGGTANVIAKSLGLGSRAAGAARRLIEGHAIDADVGLAGDEVFLMQASGGLDAEAVDSVDPDLKRKVGIAAYASAAARCWWQYDYPEIELEIDSQREKVAFFAVCNIPYYAGSLRLAPEAGFQSRALEVVTLARKGKWAALEFAAALLARRHTDLDGVEATSVERLSVLGPADLRMQIDGDPLAARFPLQIRLATERLRLLVPRRGGDG